MNALQIGSVICERNFENIISTHLDQTAVRILAYRPLRYSPKAKPLSINYSLRPVLFVMLRFIKVNLF